MRAIITRLPLLEALRVAKGVVKSNSPKPILKCVKLTAGGGESPVEVEATDLELSVRRRLDLAQVERAGAVCVSCDDLLSVVGSATTETIALDADDKGQLVIKTDAGRFALYTTDPKDFPGMRPVGDAGAGGTIAVGELRRMARQTAFATSNDNTRYAFNGVLFEFRGKRVVMAATDGRRLAISEGAGVGPKKGDGWLLPKRFLSTCDKAFDDDEAELAVAPIGGAVDVSDGRTTLRVNRIEGSFPPWEDIVPKSDDVLVETAAAALLAVLAQVAPFAADEAGNRGKGALAIDLSKASMRIAGRSPQAGEAAVDFPCKVDGGPLRIGLAANFLQDGVRAAETEDVKLGFTAPNRAMRLVAGTFQYVLMPVNLI